jgi:hypothetical protein
VLIASSKLPAACAGPWPPLPTRHKEHGWYRGLALMRYTAGCLVPYLTSCCLAALLPSCSSCHVLIPHISCLRQRYGCTSACLMPYALCHMPHYLMPRASIAFVMLHASYCLMPRASCPCDQTPGTMRHASLFMNPILSLVHSIF